MKFKSLAFLGGLASLSSVQAEDLDLPTWDVINQYSSVWELNKSGGEVSIGVLDVLKAQQILLEANQYPMAKDDSQLVEGSPTQAQVNWAWSILKQTPSNPQGDGGPAIAEVYANDRCCEDVDLTTQHCIQKTKYFCNMGAGIYNNVCTQASNECDDAPPKMLPWTSVPVKKALD